MSPSSQMSPNTLSTKVRTRQQLDQVIQKIFNQQKKHGNSYII